ncbi:hypothetical protein G647_03881 [Cladophialophora carrionii CBS 160.54]|uniref:BZIP domain-containing protein n=1 Tax=Cladophialophora carrionii CBS 160.54 TaxID=1279043 RepID=V9DEY2_9EURO|nr:uncharacterized protein G647_03881 [Cladophialophora carrionii CBS 160.54]ETI24512.1 hypothetical protein G647_03881 [Cladophialophora carrionii CBS 160.54]
MSDNTAGPSGPEPKLPGRYKRKLTEARREQNRRSQRVWRERQKQRHDNVVQAQVQQVLERRERAREREPEKLSAQSQTTGLMSSISARREEYSFPERLLDDILTQEEGIAAHDEQTVFPEPVLPVKVAVYYYVPPVAGAEDYRHSWPVPDDVEFKTYTRPPGVMDRIAPCGNLLSSSSSSLTPSEHLSPAPVYYPRSLGSQTSFPGARSRTSLPSPYRNHLQLVGESCFAATMAIAQSLGVSMQAYINDHPSPFSTTSNADVHTIPVDLRPTAYQLIIPHPSYLDCIPFPHFRSMAIYLSSVKRLDHCSLFLDLMHDGMICWGRERASAQYGRSMREGVAWNKRSWEVRRWFWRKWSWIARMTVEDVDAGIDVGAPAVAVLQGEAEFDDEDGMLSGSQWWWSLHDEEAGNTPAQEPEKVQEQEELGSLLSRVVTCNVGVRKSEESHLLVHWE